MEIDFKKLSPEQDEILREILSICEFFQVTLGWDPPLSYRDLVEKTRKLGCWMESLDGVSE